MEKKSVQDITVTELCKASGINRSTFYAHYGCPSDVLKEIEAEFLNDIRMLDNAPIDDVNCPIEKRAETICSYFYENKKLSKLLLRNSDTSSGFAKVMFNSEHVQAIHRKVFADDDEDILKMRITFFNNGIYHVIRQWILEDIPKTPKEMADLIKTFIPDPCLSNQTGSVILR